MRYKIFGFSLVCLLIFVSGGTKFNHAKAETIIQEDLEITEQKGIQIDSMKDMIVICTALTDYITDFGTAPKQDGTYDENSEFYNALVPYYAKDIQIEDKWGNNFRVYCGEACNGVYDGIKGCTSDDIIVVSYGRDGKKEDWAFNHEDPKAGLYVKGRPLCNCVCR